MYCYTHNLHRDEKKFSCTVVFKWSERYNHLEAILLAKSYPPSFSSDVRVAPSHSPPPNVGKDTEPFFQQTSSDSHVERTGPDFSVEKQLSAGKLQDSTSFKHTGPDIKDAEKLQSAGKLVTDRPPQGSSSSRRTGPDIRDAAKLRNHSWNQSRSLFCRLPV